MTSTGDTSDKDNQESIEISTPRLLLCAAREDHAHDLHEAFSDAEVMRYWSTPPHTSVAQTEEWVHKMVIGAQNGVTDFVICLKPEMIAIGKCGIWQDTEIGFMLAREHWRKGLAEEALRAVLPYFFKERGLPEIVADVDPRNRSSKALLGKLGFVIYDFKEKTFEVGGEWVDSEYLKLTRERWEEVGRK